MSQESPWENPDDPLTESDLLRKVETAMEEVVRADPEMEWDPDGNNVKRQKYLDCAVSHFTEESVEMPVTRSWFRYGRTLPAAESGPGEFGDDQNLPPSGNVLEESSIDDFIDYYENIAAHPPLTSEWWYEDTFTFLQEYYDYHTPPEYKSLYLHTLEMRSTFDDIREKIANTRKDVRNGVGYGLSPIDFYDDLMEIDAKIQLDLINHETLSPALSPVRKFQSLSERVIQKLSLTEPDEIGAEFLHIVRSLDGFFDDVVWTYPAALMSSASKEGPNQDWLANSAGWMEGHFEETFEDELDQFRKSCVTAGVLPSIDEFGPDDEVDRAVEGLMRVADRGYEQ